MGGWAAMKAARGLVQSGAVSDAVREGGTVRATVGGGRMKFRAGLRIEGRSDVVNLCTCPTSRSRGALCEHSLAAALATILKPAPAQKAVSMTSTEACQKDQKKPVSAGGRFEVFLPESLLDAAGRGAGRYAVFLRFTPADEKAPEPNPADDRLAGWLAEQGIRPMTTPLNLDTGGLSALLLALGDHPAVCLGKPGQAVKRGLRVAAEPMRVPVTLRECPMPGGGAGFQTTLDSHICGLSLTRLESGRARGVPTEQGPWFHCPETATLFRTPPAASDEVSLVLQSLANTAAPSPKPLLWLARHRAELEESAQLILEGERLCQMKLLSAPCQFDLWLDGSLQAVVAKIEVTFQGHKWPVGQRAAGVGQNQITSIFQDQLNDCVFYSIQRDDEIKAVRQLERLGFVEKPGSEWLLQGREAVLRFYGSDLPRLAAIFNVRESERWRSNTRGLLRIQPKVKTFTSEDESSDFQPSKGWLDFEICYEASNGFHLPRSTVLSLIRSGRNAARGPDGREYVLDASGCEDFEECLRDIQVELLPDGGKAAGFHLQYLQNQFHNQEVRTHTSHWITADELSVKLGNLDTILRPYQKMAVRWMEASVRQGQGVLMADDMGLGKTLQTLALLRVLRQPEAEISGNSVLIVCPKTLLGNWRQEITKFTPEFSTLIWSGSERLKSANRLHDFDVILTTYQLIYRDLNHLNKVKWRAVVLDEASYIRNPDTDAARAIHQLVAPVRIALSGTPLENGVRDLWSICQFLLPGFLGDRASFHERFEKPLSGNDSNEAQKTSNRLRRLIRPFFIRRTKQEVLPDLPEKIEQIHWCELSAAQAEIYRRVLEEGREEVRQASRRQGRGAARLTMFTILLRLRQISCDLRLSGLSSEALSAFSDDELSEKTTALMELLNEGIKSQSKTLVFSQFTSFLRLIQKSLIESKLPHSYLDGSSQDRDDQIRCFQECSETRIFLISLKAGGYGLNLTQADRVILADPWWNPAVEAQAIDRAHRFGQQKVVTAIRMIARGTVEEKILKLQATKRGLVQAVVEGMQLGATDGLSDSDLQNLLDLDGFY